MRRILFVLTALLLATAVKPLSFDETQRRYLNPNEILGLYRAHFLGWEYSYCQYMPFGGDDIMDLLGQNRPVLGAPIDSVPSSSLVARLRDCIERAMRAENRSIETDALDPQTPASRYLEKIAAVRDLIPCYRLLCKGNGSHFTNWAYVPLKELTDEEQNRFVIETLRMVWDEPLIYEDLNPGARLPDLVATIRTQLKDRSLQDAYTQIHLWAALRDEFLLF